MDVYSPTVISRILKGMGMTPSKAKGQNFLVDRRVAERIVAGLEPFKARTILEIGPGIGSLTGILLEHGYKVSCIELDKRLSLFMEDNYDVDLVQGDAVGVEWPKTDAVISNLPYCASTPITFRLLDTMCPAVFTYQKEVADRLLAPPGVPDYSRLTVATGARCKVERLFNISPNAFNPAPSITSTAVRMVPQTIYTSEELKALDRSILMLFTHRRKKISTVLKNTVKRELINDPLDLGEFGDMRPGDLSVEEHMELALRISPYWK